MIISSTNLIYWSFIPNTRGYMSTIRVTKKYQGLSADQAYKLSESALEKNSYGIWKRRPLGWLIMANIEDEGGTISGNVSCRPGNGANITLTLDSENHEESTLTNLVNKFFEVVDQMHEN